MPWAVSTNSCRDDQEDRRLANSIVTRIPDIHLRKTPSPCQSDTLNDCSVDTERTRTQQLHPPPPPSFIGHVEQQAHEATLSKLLRVTTSWRNITAWCGKITSWTATICSLIHDADKQTHQSQQITSAPVIHSLKQRPAAADTSSVW